MYTYIRTYILLLESKKNAYLNLYTWLHAAGNCGNATTTTITSTSYTYHPYSELRPPNLLQLLLLNNISMHIYMFLNKRIA